MEELDAEATDYYYKHPHAFVVDIIGAKPNHQQRQALKALPKNRRIAIRSGNGVGKTALEAWIIIWFITVFPDCRIPCTAPTNHQLTDILWPEVKKWLSRSSVKDKYEWTATSLYNKYSPDTWFAVARSSTEPTNFQGFHEENILFVIDEASGVSDEIWEAIRGSLTTANAYCIICGNPNYLAGFFYNAFHKNADMWTTFHYNAEESENVTKESIQEIIREFGIDSNQYRVRVLGEFPLEDAVNIYIPMTLLKYALFDKEKIWEETPHADYEYDLGVDPAREGSDEAVFMISKHATRYVTEPIDVVWGRAFQKSDGPMIMDYTVQLDNVWRFATIYPDETGMGGFLYDFMKRQARLPLVPITFNKLQDPSSPIRDSNKEAMYKSFKLLLERQRQLCMDKEKGLKPETTPDVIRLPNIPKLVTQLVSLRYEVKGDKLSIHHEENGHDDWADACVLSLFRYVKTRRKSSYAIA